MKLKPLVAASLAALMSIGAHATVTDWGVHDPIELGGAAVPAGWFDDTFEFTLGSASSVASNAVTLFGTFGPAAYALYGVAGDGLVGTGDDVLRGNWGFGSVSTSHTVLLGAGSYYYSVGSKTVAGGTYILGSAIVSAAPVPEPETYAMLLAGLGVVGFLARRRRFD